MRILSACDIFLRHGVTLGNACRFLTCWRWGMTEEGTWYHLFAKLYVNVYFASHHYAMTLYLHDYSFITTMYWAELYLPWKHVKWKSQVYLIVHCQKSCVHFACHPSCVSDMSPVLILWDTLPIGRSRTIYGWHANNSEIYTWRRDGTNRGHDAERICYAHWIKLWLT